jgi:hypothetical protein
MKLGTWKKLKKETSRVGMRVPVMRIDIKESNGEESSVAIINKDDYDVFEEKNGIDEFIETQIETKDSFRVKSVCTIGVFVTI